MKENVINDAGLGSRLDKRTNIPPVSCLPAKKVLKPVDCDGGGKLIDSRPRR